MLSTSETVSRRWQVNECTVQVQTVHWEEEWAQCYSVHNKSDMDWPGIDSEPPRRETGV